MQAPIIREHSRTRRIIAPVVTLGMLGLAAALVMPTQAQTAFHAAETRQIDNAEPAQIKLASYAVNTRPDRVERICRKDVAVKRNGHIIGHLNKGQMFKVIRPIFGEFGVEPVAYFGFAYGNVNAYGKVPASAFNCH